jgi:hypothetical protein
MGLSCAGRRHGAGTSESVRVFPESAMRKQLSIPCGVAVLVFALPGNAGGGWGPSSCWKKIIDRPDLKLSEATVDMMINLGQFDLDDD